MYLLFAYLLSSDFSTITGREVLNQLQHSVASAGVNGRGGGGEEEPMPTLDMLEAQKQVKRVVHYLEQRVESLRGSLDTRDKTLNLASQFKDWRSDVKTVSF